MRNELQTTKGYVGLGGMVAAFGVAAYGGDVVLASTTALATALIAYSLAPVKGGDENTKNGHASSDSHATFG